MNTTLALVYTLPQQFKTIPCAIDIPFVQFFFPCTTIQKQFHAPSTSPSYNSFSPCTKRLEGAPAGIVQFFFTIPAGIVQFTYNTYQGKTGDTVKSDFSSYGFGKNCIYHVIPHAIRVPKKYILSMLEISRVITIPIPLCSMYLDILEDTLSETF